MIQLAYPLGLLSLAAIPLIVLLHLLRPRRRRVVLSSTALWREVLADRERGLGLRRLLGNVSLLLLLLIALLLGLALSGPQWLTDTREQADTVIVLDVSASMKTRSSMGRTRFDEALSEAAAIVDRLPRDGRMLVMTSGQRALLRTGFETDRATLTRALAELRAGDEAGRPREALALALSLLQGREGGRIYFLTDGAFDADVHAGSSQVAVRIVGAPARNVAITRFDIRPEPANDERFQVLMTVRNYTDASVSVPASASLEGRALLERTLELKAREQQTLVLPFNGSARGRAVARIRIDDDLAADNQAFAAAEPLPPIRVLLFTTGNFYLQSVLEALPGVQLVKREWAQEQDLADLARIFDVVVLDAVPAPRLPPGNFLLINTVASDLPFADAGAVAQPLIIGRGTSALVRDVDLSAVRIAEARRVTIRGEVPGLQRLFWSRETDLALALMHAESKIVYVGFDLGRSNFPLQVAFPLFFMQSMEWLRRHNDDDLSTQTQAGAPYPIAVPAGQSEVIVKTPSGTAMPVMVKDGMALFDATFEAGIYQYDIGGTTRYFAVSLNDARESDVSNRTRAAVPVEATQADAAERQRLIALWPYLLMLAIIVIGVEWWVWSWSRRSA